MRVLFKLALLPVLFLSVPVSAQIAAPANQYNLGDGNRTACGVGEYEACFAVEFGRCADANPRIAIAACTRQLLAQDNRMHPGNIRFNRAIMYALRANALLKQGNVDRALADYDRAVRSERRIFWIHSRRGEAYFSQGGYEEALESFDAAVELNPDSAAVLVNRALVLAAAPDEELRNPAQALADAQRANELAPRQPAYIDALACAHAANGDFESAVEEQRRAITWLRRDDQETIDNYRVRLDLYQQGMPYLMAPAT
jgi:tetratricopeptide (TPR) repeat protein